MHFHRCPRCTSADSMVGRVFCTETTCTVALRLCVEHGENR